ncbi:MAG: T9SS type A sorting domain-containing protein [Bacteroidales bacterium]|nr:T9SS type A sorting domain-containing protein [Bacteroidales bacterium]
MKKILFSFGMLLSVSLIYAQMNLPFGHDTLNINNWAVKISANNSNFWDIQTSNATAEIPQGSGSTSIFSGNFWIGGLDSNNNLYVSADRYFANGACFTPGPYANTYDSLFYVKYNRVWKINKSEIEYHINHWNDPGYTMPEAIENWPGNGNMINGEAPVLAPYVDANGNSIYDPQNGDYPYILGDQAIYYILNDKNNTDTTLVPMGLEIHVMFYAFQDTGVINNTFFVHCDVINKSVNTYHDVYCGINTDIDIGNGFDDYIGCDSTQNLYFGYNGDNDDDGTHGYGTYPPALGVLFLSHPMTSFMYYTNGGGDPTTNAQYYNYLTAHWNDGTHLQFGGTGHLSGGGDANFMFPVYSGWSEESEGNTPDDRRGVASISLGNVSANYCFTADVAYVWSRDTINPNPHSSVDLLLSQAPDVVQFANQLGIDSNCTYLTIYNGINNPYASIEYLNIFPNPATDIVTIKTNLKNYTLSVYSQLGQKVFEQENTKQLNVSSLNAGIYLIRIVSGNKSDWRKLIVE